MKWKIAIFALIIILVSFSYSFSEEVSVEGEVGIKGVYAGVTGGEGGRAKFTEYRDLKQGVSAFGRARLNFDSEKYFLNVQGGDFAYDTQFYGIEGGMWGKFKFDLFYNEIPHNITFDGRTFYQYV
jgi:hypothetical protein